MSGAGNATASFADAGAIRIDRYRVEALQIRAVIAANTKAAAAGIPAAAFVAAGIIWGAGAGAAPMAVAWAAVASALALYGMFLGVRFNVRVRSDEEAYAWGDRLTVLALVSGFVWGSVAWLFLPAPTVQHPWAQCLSAQEVWIVMAVGVTVLGGAGAQAVYRPLVTCFVLTTLGIFSAGLIRVADPFHFLLAAGGFFYAAIVLLFARSQELAVSRSIALGLEKEALLGDRTAQYLVAQQAQQAAEDARQFAEQADRSKTAFIAAASHDLRQPMHALSQYVHHLQRRTTAPDDHATVEKIQRALGAMEDLLNAVLDFSKFTIGSVKPVIAPVSLHELFARIELQVRPEATEKGLQLRFLDTSLVANTDAILLERVLRNFLSNAVTHTAAGGIRVRAVRRPSGIAIQVFDTGPGIPRADRARIFDEYVQLDNPARDRRKGLGLGLAIVRQIVRRGSSERSARARITYAAPACC